jgi:hypothetical protein
VSEPEKPKKKSESAQQLAAAEEAAQARFEKAMTELREGSHRFASKMRGETEIDLEELIDPEGDVVANIADVEGDAGAIALAVPVELLTFDTWLFGQIGDKEELDLKDESHWEMWFTFGAWIGETLRRRHGGHWILFGDDPHTWRIGFSKIFLEIAPFVFAEQLLRMGSGAIRKMVTEIEKIREQHDETAEKEPQGSLDRFLPQHYLRLHTVPLGQWMAMDFATVSRLWNEAPTKELIVALREAGPRLGPQNQQIVERVVRGAGPRQPGQAGQRADQRPRPVRGGRPDHRAAPRDRADRDRHPRARGGAGDARRPARGLPAARRGRPRQPAQGHRAVRVLLRGRAAPAPGRRRGLPRQHPPRAPVDAVRRSQHARDRQGRLGGDQPAVPGADAQGLRPGGKLLDKYDDFVKYVGSQPDAPRRRDDGRMLAETAVRRWPSSRQCVGVAASSHNDALLFRLLPPPG